MSGIDESGRRLSGVRQGMRVVDSNGDEVGTVERVRMGDPGAVTAEGQQGDAQRGLLGEVADAVTGGSGVPEGAGERLARVGFVQVDAKGMFAGDRFVAADQVESVEGDVVRLGVDKDQLLG